MSTSNTQNYDNNKIASLLTTADQHIKDNKFQLAYDIYIDLIKDYKNSAEIYNNLAICAYQIKLHSECREYIQTAIKLDPDNPLYIVQYAQFLYASEFKQAENLFKQAIELASNIQVEPDNNQYSHKESIEQIKYYYANLLYNQACLLAKDLTITKQKQAIELFLKSIENKPKSDKALYNIACCYFNLEDNDNGIKYLRKTIELNNNHSQAHFGLSQYYQQINNTELAEQHLKKSLEYKNTNSNNKIDLNKDNAEYNYGVLEQQRENLEQALKHYNNCLNTNPLHFAACYNTASIYQKQNDINQAIRYYKQALKINPQSKTCEYLISALKQSPLYKKEKDKNTTLQEPPKEAPGDYIEDLFDDYAEKFDQILINDLLYKTPEYLYGLFIKNTDVENQFNLNTLDLGCGTGLSGGLFKKHSANISGVDLSQNMLNMAAKKNIYNNLIKSDINKFLEKNNIKFNLITLTDVLVYFGDLDKIFNNIKNNLSIANNYILFSTELLTDNIENNSYLLTENGRYIHSHNYIKNILNKYSFKIIAEQQDVIRQQNNQNVDGLLVLASLVQA